MGLTIRKFTRLMKALIYAIFVDVLAGNEAARFEAVSKPDEAIAGHLPRARPEFRIVVALQRICEQLLWNMRIVRRNRMR